MPALRGVRGAYALLLASLLLLTSTPPTFAATNLSVTRQSEQYLLNLLR